MKQADAGGQEESGGLFVLALRNEDAFDIPLNVSTLNSDIWIGCTVRNIRFCDHTNVASYDC